MPDFRKLSDADLVDFCENLAAQAPALSGALVPAPMLLTLTTNQARLETSIQQQLLNDSSALSATEIKNADRAETEAALATIKMQMRANGNPPSDFEMLGFGALDTATTPIDPNDPTDLVARGDSTNQNFLRWKGNNRSGSVIYIVEQRVGNAQEYTFLAAVTAQKYVHQGVSPGTPYRYRVKAQAATKDSAWSNTATVYEE